jgi:hypothetical protein
MYLEGLLAAKLSINTKMTAQLLGRSGQYGWIVQAYPDKSLPFSGTLKRPGMRHPDSVGDEGVAELAC